MQCFGSPDHGLGRHTTDVDTGATNSAVTNQGDLCALLGCRNRGGETSRARADDGQIIRPIGVCHSFHFIGFDDDAKERR